MRHPISLAMVCALLATALPAGAATIVDEWSTLKPPAAPTLQAVTVDPKTTALLVLDFVKQTCNDQVRPRCVAALPSIAKLLKGARDSKTMVVYSLFLGPDAVTDIVPPLAPQGDEPVVRATPDKFIGTDLEKTLRDHGISTVIVVGVAAEGAALMTAAHAAELGFNVIVPLEGERSSTPYGEQVTAWTLANAPVIGAKVKLTSVDMVTF